MLCVAQNADLPIRKMFRACLLCFSFLNTFLERDSSKSQDIFTQYATAKTGLYFLVYV